MRVRKGSFLLLALVLSLVGVLAASDAGARGSGVPATRWLKREVRVCFAAPELVERSHLSQVKNLALRAEKENLHRSAHFREFTPAEKNAIQEIIQEEFRIARTGVEFVGWSDCGSSADVDSVDVLLFMNTRLSSSFSTLADRGDAAADGEGFHTDTVSEARPSIFFSHLDTRATQDHKLQPLVSLRRIALHEFGHLSGLLHEHGRIEALKDPNCRGRSTWFGTDPDAFIPGVGGHKVFSAPVRDGLKYFSVYDPSSIMSYCVLQSGGQSSDDEPNTLTWEIEVNRDLKRPWHRFRDFSLLADEPEFSRDGTRLKMRLRVGLSVGDVHALRCLHEVYPESQRYAICAEDYDPITQSWARKKKQPAGGAHQARRRAELLKKAVLQRDWRGVLQLKSR